MSNGIAFGTILDSMKKLLLLNGIFFAAMSLFRLAFFLYYGNREILGGSGEHVVRAFILGMRFDLSVVAYINALVTLSIVAVWFIGKRRLFDLLLHVLAYYYGVMFSLVFIILIADFGFYSYFKNHLNILIFGILEDDTKALFLTILKNYNLPLVLAATAALIAGTFAVSRYFVSRIRNAAASHVAFDGLRFKAGFCVILFSVNFLAARGSLGMFPLGTIDAEISPSAFINKLGLNGIFTLQEAVDFRMKEDNDYRLSEAAGYGNGQEKAFADFLGVSAERLQTPLHRNLVRKTGKNPAAERLQPNVVVIIMEGFGSDLLKYHSERFNVYGTLKRHFDADHVFYNFLPSDVGTIGSLESVALNIPKRPMAKAVTQSRYAFDRHLSGAAFPYKRAGYDTVFVYGGNTGWRNIISFMSLAGFDTVEGEGSMPDAYLRNEWGVYDEFMFDHIFAKLRSPGGRPKFILALSTSNHPPYSLPPHYRRLPLEVSPELGRRITGDRKLALGRFSTYQYANQRLGEFITRIKHSALGKNTIIAVTGDHNFWSVFDYPVEEYLGLAGVPLYLYVPEALEPPAIDTGVFGSHIDIMPTLYHLSLSEQEYLAMGNNLLDPSVPHIAYNVDGMLLTRDEAVQHALYEGHTVCYRWDTAVPGRLRPCDRKCDHDRLVTHYRSAMAVTDFLIRHPVKEVNGKI